MASSGLRKILLYIFLRPEKAMLETGESLSIQNLSSVFVRSI